MLFVYIHIFYKIGKMLLDNLFLIECGVLLYSISYYVHMHMLLNIL